MPQTRVDAPIAPQRDQEAQHAPSGDVPNVVPVVLAPADRNDQGAQQRRDGEQRERQGGAGFQRVQLRRHEERYVAQPREGEGGVARGEGPPAVLQEMVRCFRADGYADQGVGRGAGGFAAREEVRAGAADGVFDHVGEEDCYEDAAGAGLVSLCGWGELECGEMVCVCVCVCA